MITQLNITNFQSHVKSVLKLSPGINVICGPSDSGKSAIIRGLRWVIENQPTGKGGTWAVYPDRFKAAIKGGVK
jgi:exonuclease SbcC